MCGLECEVVRFEVWQAGDKMDVYFEGQRCRSFEEQRLRADREAERAQREAEKAQREAEKAQREAEKAQHETDARREAETSERLATQRAEKLAAKLRALGIDPDAD